MPNYTVKAKIKKGNSNTIIFEGREVTTNVPYIEYIILNTTILDALSKIDTTQFEEIILKIKY